MNINEFITIVGALTLINDLVVQFIKTKITDKNTTLVAFISAIALALIAPSPFVRIRSIAVVIISSFVTFTLGAIIFPPLYNTRYISYVIIAYLLSLVNMFI